MNQELINEILEEVRVRCPNATLEESKYSWHIILSAGASDQQVKYIAKWSDFSGLSVREGCIVANFDK